MTAEMDPLAMLRATGYRVTSQRQLVLGVVETSGEHLDAEGIHQRARQKDPKISLATVYRTLNVLKHMGLIEQRYLTRDHARENYEPVGAPEHYHFTCLACHQVIEFESPRVKQMQHELRRELDIEVSHACICLEGYCQACSAKRKAAQE